MSNAGGIRSLVLVLIVAASSVPAVVASAQEGVGSFRVVCAPSHAGAFDPIVYPGQSPAGHHHEFYGSRRTDPSSSPETLLGTATTCSDAADASAYWHPTLYVDGVRTPASLVSVYYTQRTPRKPADLAVVPTGLRVVAGDMHAASAQNNDRVWWDCDGVEMEDQPTAPSCPSASRGLEANVRFPDCWDGVNLDSVDHKSHMSYSTNSGGTFVCDAAHPVQLPHVQLIIRWDDMYVLGESITLASGSTLTLHADFMNAWRQDRLAALQEACIRTRTECGRIDSGSQPVAPTATAPPTTAAAMSANTAAASHHSTMTATKASSAAQPGVTMSVVNAHHQTEGSGSEGAHSPDAVAAGDAGEEGGVTTSTAHQHEETTRERAATEVTSLLPAAPQSEPGSSSTIVWLGVALGALALLVVSWTLHNRRRPTS